MSFVVTDGKNHNEFATLDEALAFRKDMPLSILRKDELGNMHKIPLKELSAAVQKKDYGEKPTESDPAVVELEHKDAPPKKTSMAVVLMLFAVGLVAAIGLVWWVLR